MHPTSRVDEDDVDAGIAGVVDGLQGDSCKETQNGRQEKPRGEIDARVSDARKHVDKLTQKEDDSPAASLP